VNLLDVFMHLPLRAVSRGEACPGLELIDRDCRRTASGPPAARLPSSSDYGLMG
jgi:hypothetical protein